MSIWQESRALEPWVFPGGCACPPRFPHPTIPLFLRTPMPPPLQPPGAHHVALSLAVFL